jgi:hypothetical protein
MTRRQITAAGGAALIAVALVVSVAETERRAPRLCAPELVPHGAQCCAPGQTLREGACHGEPASCPASMRPAKGELAGCVAVNSVIRFEGGTIGLPPPGWSSLEMAAPLAARVGPFFLDTSEVTRSRYAPCEERGRCTKLAPGAMPGEPVTGLTADEAEAFCRFSGGRLPRSEEWVFAATGPGGRRFPWGNTGLVCRRAAFGMVNGPCREGGGVTLSNAHPEGATPEGVHDLAGNVAEWTREQSGRAVTRGGSYRSALAAGLETRSVEHTQGANDDVGVRCAYDEAP